VRIGRIPQLRFFLERPCACCGSRVRYQLPVIWDELAEQWNLTRKLRRLMDQREGRKCLYCGTNWRIRHLASVLLADIGVKIGKSYRDIQHMARNRASHALRIAEINLLPGLHKYLSPLPGLTYSEYGGENSQDVMDLTYQDATFDYVLTSDTLEHIPDFDLALSEIRRVLRPGGKHIFTIPVVWDRKTRQRADVVSGSKIHHLPPSHHGAPEVSAEDYLVYNEFGGDVIERIEKAGFSVALAKEPRNELVATFVAARA